MQIWPLLSGLDDGKYECYEDHESKGAVSLHIISVKANIFFHRMQFLIQSIIQNSKFHKWLKKLQFFQEGIWKGIFNFFTTILFAVPLIAFALLYRLYLS